MENMNSGESLTLTYSAVSGQGTEKKVNIRFERRNGEKIEFAEGVIPDGKIEKSIGFTQQELAGLELYLKEHTGELFQKAKKINEQMFWKREE
ncbi:MAG: hypothetical protein RR364_03335 [Lachnospiraceae bacterium]